MDSDPSTCYFNGTGMGCQAFSCHCPATRWRGYEHTFRSKLLLNDGDLSNEAIHLSGCRFASVSQRYQNLWMIHNLPQSYFSVVAASGEESTVTR